MTRALAVALLAAGLRADARAAADPVMRWRPIVAEASARFGVPAAWIERVMRSESGGLAVFGGRSIRSEAGAIGLMQLMPATWATLRTSYRLGTDPDDPHDNILAGTAFLRQMYDRFGYPGLFAAYNAGPGRYAAYLARRSRLPAETVAYLVGLTGGRSGAAVSVATPPRRPLFVLRHDVAAAEQPTFDQAVGDTLFAIRKAVP